MNDIVRYLSLGLTLGSAFKAVIFGASWQVIAALGIIAAVTLVVYGIQESTDMKSLRLEVEGLRARLNKIEKRTEDTQSEMSALRMNKGITTRRIG